MTRVFIADGKTPERSALRRLLVDLNMQVVDEAADWPTTLALVPIDDIELLVLDWDVLPNEPCMAVEQLRKVCPATLVIVLISGMDAPQQAAISAGADAFISKSETSEKVADRLRAFAVNKLA